MKMIVLLSALAGAASAVVAQGTLPAFPLESEIRIEVWNGTSWGNTVNASPGQQVEYRVVMHYTGPRTDLLGLGDSRYQVSFSNADNTGASRDTLAAFPGDGTSTYTQNMLTAAEGTAGGALPAYGRVTYGGWGQIASTQTRLRSFRHGGDVPQAGAPTGSWLRVAGEFVNVWPVDALPTGEDATATNLNRVMRGMSASQVASQNALTSLPNTYFVGGVSNLVVFRHAIVLSDLADVRTMEVSVPVGSLNRRSLAGSPDDRRYIQWHETEIGSLGSYRTAVEIVPATIVIPTPGAMTLVSVAGLMAMRRRR
jgi:hypothetical protein